MNTNGQPTPPPIPDGAGVHQFKLKDADGKEHQYLMTYHPTTEGQDIMWQLVVLGAEPLARVVQQAIGAYDEIMPSREEVEQAIKDGEANPVQRFLDVDVGALLRRVNLPEAAADIKRSVLRMNMAKLGRDILQFTARDGWNLSDDRHFNEAYRANYWEYLRALWEVVVANRFFPQLDTLSDLKPEDLLGTGPK